MFKRKSRGLLIAEAIFGVVLALAAITSFYVGLGYYAKNVRSGIHRDIAEDVAYSRMADMKSDSYQWRADRTESDSETRRGMVYQVTTQSKAVAGSTSAEFTVAVGWKYQENDREVVIKDIFRCSQEAPTP